jgi:predicted Zn-dependent protease
LKELLTKINDAAIQKFGADYAEARAQSVSKTMLTLKEGRVEAAKQGIENGVALRCSQTSMGSAQSAQT